MKGESNEVGDFLADIWLIVVLSVGDGGRRLWGASRPIHTSQVVVLNTGPV